MVFPLVLNLFCIRVGARQMIETVLAKRRCNFECEMLISEMNHSRWQNKNIMKPETIYSNKCWIRYAHYLFSLNELILMAKLASTCFTARKISQMAEDICWNHIAN